MAVKWESNFSFMWGKKTPSAITQSDISDDLFYGVQIVPIPHPAPQIKIFFFQSNWIWWRNRGSGCCRGPRFASTNSYPFSEEETTHGVRDDTPGDHKHAGRSIKKMQFASWVHLNEWLHVRKDLCGRGQPKRLYVTWRWTHADRNRDVCVAEVYQPPLRLCLNFFLPAAGGGGGGGEEEQHKELLRQFSVNQCGFGCFKGFIPSVYYLWLLPHKGRLLILQRGWVWGEQGMMGRQRLPRWDYQVRKMRNERRNIKVTEQSVFCDIDFHMINPGDSFPCYCHQGLMRKVICSQATLNISSSACIIWQGNLSQNTAKARDGGVETPASVPGRSVSPSLCRHGGAITHSKPLGFN